MSNMEQQRWSELRNDILLDANISKMSSLTGAEIMDLAMLDIFEEAREMRSFVGGLLNDRYEFQAGCATWIGDVFREEFAAKFGRRRRELLRKVSLLAAIQASEVAMPIPPVCTRSLPPGRIPSMTGMSLEWSPIWPSGSELRGPAWTESNNRQASLLHRVPTSTAARSPACPRSLLNRQSMTHSVTNSFSKFATSTRTMKRKVVTKNEATTVRQNLRQTVVSGPFSIPLGLQAANVKSLQPVVYLEKTVFVEDYSVKIYRPRLMSSPKRAEMLLHQARENGMMTSGLQFLPKTCRLDANLA